VIQVSIADQSVSLDAIVEFAESIFTAGSDAGRTQRKILTNNPAFACENFVVARDNDRIVGVIRMVPRIIFLKGQSLPCMGISTVAVDPEFRHKGIATKMIQVAHAAGKDRGFGLAVLHARRVLDGFYPRFGYVGVGRYGKLTVLEPPSVSIKGSVQAGHITELHMQSYERMYKKLSGSFLRSHEQWQFIAATQLAVVGGNIQTLMLGARPVGYVVVCAGVVVEIAYSHDVSCVEIVEILCKAGLVEFNIHPRHPLFIYLRSTFTTEYVERFTQIGGYMACVLNIGVLTSVIRDAVSPGLWEQSSMAGQKDLIRIDFLGARFEVGKSLLQFNNTGALLRCVLGVVAAESVFCDGVSQEAAIAAALLLNAGYHSSVLDDV